MLKQKFLLSGLVFLVFLFLWVSVYAGLRDPDNTNCQQLTTDGTGIHSCGTDTLDDVCENGATTDVESTFQSGLIAGAGAAGDSSIKMYIQSVAKWIFGTDDSDSDKFVISSGGALGTNNAIEIDSNSDIVIIESLSSDNDCGVPHASFFGEESVGLDAGTYEFSMGNGDLPTVGSVQPCSGTIVSMSVICESCTDATPTDSTVEIRVDTTGTNCETDIDTAGGIGANDYYGTDTACTDTFTAGQTLRAYTIDDDGTCQGCVATWWVVYD
jgi:hypothetical protein